MSSHTQPASSLAIHPSKETLGEMLDLDEWSLRARIAEQGGTLPRWLEVKADDGDDT